MLPINESILFSLNVAPTSFLGLHLWNISLQNWLSQVTQQNRYPSYKCYLKFHNYLHSSVSFLELPFSFLVTSKNLVYIYLVDPFRNEITLYLIRSTRESHSWHWVVEDKEAVSNISAFPTYLAECLAHSLFVHSMIYKCGLTKSHWLPKFPKWLPPKLCLFLFHYKNQFRVMKYNL